MVALLRSDTIRPNPCGREIPLEDHLQDGEWGSKCEDLQSEILAAGERHTLGACRVSVLDRILLGFCRWPGRSEAAWDSVFSNVYSGRHILGNQLLQVDSYSF